jgi:hypothetical protein
MAEGGRPCRYGVQRGITRRPHASMVSLYTAYSAQGHHLIWIDVVHVTVGKEEGFEAQGPRLAVRALSLRQRYERSREDKTAKRALNSIRCFHTTLMESW